MEIGMSERNDWKRRLGDKPARKAFTELYGPDADKQGERYARLAETVEGSSPETAAKEELRFYSAPGRTELGGNHTDHNRGRVLCAAVRLDAAACVAPSDDKIVRLASEGFDPIKVDLSSLGQVKAERGSTASLVRGVAASLAARGWTPRGFSCALSSSVLPGSGLSSSAAIEVLLGTIMADLGDLKVPPVEIAKIGQRAENEYFGKPCGLMDQTASAVGGVVAIDFADPESPKVKRVEYDFAEEGYDLLVVNTGGSHADLTADYASVPVEMKEVAAVLGASYLREVDPAAIIARGPEIRSSCGDRAFLRALHFVADNARVVDMVEALEADDLGAYLKLVKKSGRSSWEFVQNLYPCSAPKEQGLPVALALSSDYLGRKGAWRVHGGGFAGTIQAYAPRKLTAGYTELMERYFGPGSVIPVAVRQAGAVRVKL
jgi:galactokinase